MKLTNQKELKELFDYNEKTGLFKRLKAVSKYKSGSIAGALQKDGYIHIMIHGKQYSLHRLAWIYFYGKWPSGHIDHINGVKSDNRISNLRDVSHITNMQNQRKPRKDNQSGYLGVCLDKRINKYHASIQVNGVKKHLGMFFTPEEASSAYLNAKRKMHADGCTI